MRFTSSPPITNIWHESIAQIMRRTDAAVRCLESKAVSADDAVKKIYRDEVLAVVPDVEAAVVICKGDPLPLRRKLAIPDMIAGVPVRVQQATKRADGNYEAEFKL
jgi:hypothetical protein